MYTACSQYATDADLDLVLWEKVVGRSTWPIVRLFYRSPWFKRIWCVQEIVLAPQEARRQACTAAAHYLVMLDSLARCPHDKNDYQFSDSHRIQMFAITPFGAHWHVMVGYRRPRSAQEHAGCEGLSETVYVREPL